MERSHFPAPDSAITKEGDATAQLRARWRQVRLGKEPLHTAAYWIYTRIAKGADLSPHQLNIASTVFRKFSELSTLSNDPLVGRKVSSDARPLTDAEMAWLRAAIDLLLRRVMESEAGFAGLPQITMSDLPGL